MPGYIVVIEGGHGAGKTIQARKLYAALLKSDEDSDVILVREPGGTVVGETVRSILLNAEKMSLDPRAACLLFNASRAQLIKEEVLPVLARGGIVILDRYYPSTLMYQPVFSDGAFTKEDAIPIVAFTLKDVPPPSLIIILDVPVETAHTRNRERDRSSERYKRSLIRDAQVQDEYRRFEGIFGERTVHIDATQDEDVVYKTILRACMEMIGGKGEYIDEDATST